MELNKSSNITITEAYVESFLKTSDFLKGLTKEEETLFVKTAVAYQLNPYKREIKGFITSDNGNRKFVITVGYEVYLQKAETSGKLDSYSVRIENVGEDLKAIVIIHRTDKSHPFVFESYLSESILKDTQGNPTGFWAIKPKFQLKKTALSQGFRAAFPEILGGIPYDLTELNSTVLEETVPQESPIEEPEQRSIEKKYERKPKQVNEITSKQEINQILDQNKDMFTNQHYNWCLGKLEVATNWQLAGLKKHILLTISQGGDPKPSYRKNPNYQNKTYSRQREPIPVNIY